MCVYLSLLTWSKQFCLSSRDGGSRRGETSVAKVEKIDKEDRKWKCRGRKGVDVGRGVPFPRFP